MTVGPVRAIVVMGPSGCGKSTMARALADSFGWAFIEGDDCHPPANRARMAAGISLDDKDRQPFLDAVGRALASHPQGAVAACSALKRAYRDRLRQHAGNILFVLPALDRMELENRMAERPGHFMPASLLASQLATLEAPTPDETACRVPGGWPLDEQVSFIRHRMSAT